MKRPLTATTAAAAAASTQRHEAAKQKRALAAQAAAITDTVRLLREAETELERTRDERDQWARLNQWMVERAFEFRVGLNEFRLCRQNEGEIQAEYKAWTGVLPRGYEETSIKFERSTSTRMGFGFRFNGEVFHNSQRDPRLRESLIKHISMTFAQHVLAALLEADGDNTGADRIRAQFEGPAPDKPISADGH